MYFKYQSMRLQNYNILQCKMSSNKSIKIYCGYSFWSAKNKVSATKFSRATMGKYIAQYLVSENAQSQHWIKIKKYIVIPIVYKASIYEQDKGTICILSAKILFSNIRTNHQQNQFTGERFGYNIPHYTIWLPTVNRQKANIVMQCYWEYFNKY